MLRREIIAFFAAVVGTFIVAGIGAVLPYRFGFYGSMALGAAGAVVGWIVGYVWAA